MESMDQIMSQFTGYFANAMGIFWFSFALLAVLGAGLLAAGGRYFKRLLFIVGAVPTYLVLHCLANQFGWSEAGPIFGALAVGVIMVLASWAYIYTWGFWTSVGIAALCVCPFLNFADYKLFDYVKVGWMFAVFGVAGGCFALIKQRHIIIVVTALTGAFFFVIGITALFAGASIQSFASVTPSVFMITLCVIYLVIAAVGIFVQYKYTVKQKLTTVEEDGKQVTVVKKSKFCYVLLALTFGYIGVHSLYAGRYVKGAIQMVIAAFAGFFSFVPLVVTWLWAVGSIFRTSKNLAVNPKPIEVSEDKK